MCIYILLYLKYNNCISESIMLLLQVKSRFVFLYVYITCIYTCGRVRRVSKSRVDGTVCQPAVYEYIQMHQDRRAKSTPRSLVVPISTASHHTISLLERVGEVSRRSRGGTARDKVARSENASQITGRERRSDVYQSRRLLRYDNLLSRSRPVTKIAS